MGNCSTQAARIVRNDHSTVQQFRGCEELAKARPTIIKMPTVWLMTMHREVDKLKSGGSRRDGFTRRAITTRTQFNIMKPMTSLEAGTVPDSHKPINPCG